MSKGISRHFLSQLLSWLTGDFIVTFTRGFVAYQKDFFSQGFSLQLGVRNFTSEYAAKFYMVWDGLWRRRTDGALVRLITSLRTVGKSRCASPFIFYLV
ncbi:MAG: exosortase-associated EpsI family protein [Deltaproteobacteria bacterium]|nr:exosortase-associated EpsI family protein [Deltaproteobacteria bacterium]